MQLQQFIMFTGSLFFVRYCVGVDHCGEHTRTDTGEGHLRGSEREGEREREGGEGRGRGRGRGRKKIKSQRQKGSELASFPGHSEILSCSYGENLWE